MSRILAILLIALGVGAHLPTWALEFTADRITTIDGRTGKDALFYRDDMWRLEHHAMGPVTVSIVRKDKRIVWLLLSRIRHFKTVPYSGEQDPMVTEKLEGEVSREEIGQETREGHQTILYEVTTKQNERTEVYYQWVATDIRFPMPNFDGVANCSYKARIIGTCNDQAAECQSKRALPVGCPLHHNTHAEKTP